MALIAVFSFTLRTATLTHPQTYYFDEVYHAFTAREYLHGNADAYDPWAHSPVESTAYEWTHPPLAKLIMSAMMALVGENSFGWRLGSVLAGTGVMVMAALIARQVFNSTRTSLLTALLISLDGLFFVQSRIAMNDIYFLFLLLCSLYFYLICRSSGKLKLMTLSGAFFGLAIASKWTAIFILPIFALDSLSAWLKEKKRPPFREISFLISSYAVIPAVIYLVSYTHYFFMGYSMPDFIELQKQMWYYHTKLAATHDYQSHPLQWIFDLRPVWMYVNYDTPGRISNIYNLANPIICLAGFLAFYVGVFRLAQRWSRARWIISLCYLVFWVPWLISPRIMFFYHYLPSLIFLCMILASAIDQLLASRKQSGRMLGLGILGLAGLWFVVFFPHLTGLPVPAGLANKVYFFVPTWK